MTQEEKQLLIIDLCERLPYKVKVSVKHKDRNFDDIIDNLTGVLCAVYPDDERIIVDELDKAIAPVNVRCGGFLLDESEAKPYLRSMSSMTDEEIIEWNIMADNCNDKFDSCFIDYCNRKYIDYRGLISKGLALEAPEGMYG